MNAIKNTQKPYNLFYKISTVIIALAFLITGVGNLVPFQHIASDMIHLGYPSYFLKILGFWKLMAGLIMIFPLPNKFKDFAYVGMMLDLTGAALSRFFVGDAFFMVLIPICISILVTLNYWVRNTSLK
jgi:hypothetical protein